jgi:hypothetical protein
LGAPEELRALFVVSESGSGDDDGCDEDCDEGWKAEAEASEPRVFKTCSDDDDEESVEDKASGVEDETAGETGDDETG